MANQYSGTCRDCGAFVPAGGGNFHRVAGKFEVRCRSCINECNKARLANPALTYNEWRTEAQLGNNPNH